MWYRTLGTNCAHIYNDGLALKSLSPSLPAACSKSLVLDVGDVWNYLCLHRLLEDCEERDCVLELPHDTPTQVKHLQPAMIAQNDHMAGPGQEEWNHGCDLCVGLRQMKPESKVRYISILMTSLTSDILIFV